MFVLATHTHIPPLSLSSLGLECVYGWVCVEKQTKYLKHTHAGRGEKKRWQAGSLNPSHTAGGRNGTALWWMSCGEILSQHHQKKHQRPSRELGAGRAGKWEKCGRINHRLVILKLKNACNCFEGFLCIGNGRLLSVELYMSNFFALSSHSALSPHIHPSIFLTSVLTGCDLQAPANRQACKLLAHVRWRQLPRPSTLSRWPQNILKFICVCSIYMSCIDAVLFRVVYWLLQVERFLNFWAFAKWNERN